MLRPRPHCSTDEPAELRAGGITVPAAGAGREKRMSWYGGFAERQFRVHRSKTAEQSVRFFRRSIDHTLLWIMVLRGHYVDKPPTVKEIILQSRCSKETVRKIIARALLKGYLVIEVSDRDRRRRLVRPTRLTVAEYERLVDGYRSFFLRTR